MGRRRKPISIPCTHPGKYSTSWFEQYAEPLWKKWLLPLKGQVKSYLELGVCEGRSMVWIMENLQPQRAIGIDPYLPDKPDHAPNYAQFEANMRENLKPWLDSGVLTVYKQRSIDFLRDQHREIPDGSVDLCYLDGSHMAWDLMTDVGLVWPKLKRPGGILLFDDYQKVYHLARPLTRVAWWCFTMAYDNRYELFFKEGRQVAVRRLK